MAGLIDMAQASWPDIDAAVAAGALAILPVGATEQHGAHLPLTTDTDLAGGVARQIAEALGAVLLPPLAYGDAWNNEDFPGTISLSPATLTAAIGDIGKGVHRIGFKALIVLNGHFGNREPIALAARALNAAGLPVLCLDYPGLETIAGAICESKPAAPGFFHADEVETAMMLALRPQAVAMARAEAEYPVFPPGFGYEPMQLRAVSRTGVFGDPLPATAEKGERLITAIVDACLDIIALFRQRHGV